MKQLAGSLLALILTLISFLHFYWAFGGKLFADNVLPETNNTKVFIPGFFATIIVAILLLSAAFIISVKASLLQLYIYPFIFTLGIWVIFSVFILRSIGDFKYVGLFKKIKDTKFSQLDSNVYSPLCLSLAFLTFIVIYN